jgi:hypothetical protein
MSYENRIFQSYYSSLNIDTFLDEFSLFSNDEKFNGNFSDGLISLVAKKTNGASIYCRNYEHTDYIVDEFYYDEKYFDDYEMTIAIKHTYTKPLLCNLYFENEIIHSFITYPNKTEWIFDGIPLFKSERNTIHVKFTDVETLEDIKIPYKCYHCVLSCDISRPILFGDKVSRMGLKYFKHHYNFWGKSYEIIDTLESHHILLEKKERLSSNEC